MKKLATVILLFSLLVSPPCQGTTVIVIVVRAGIVIAADGLAMGKTLHSSAIRTRAVTKVFLNKEKRIGLASVGFAGIEGSNYDFTQWARDILDQTKSDTTAEQFTGIVKEAANRNKFKFSSLPTEVLRPGPSVICKTFVSYIIVGYEQNRPEVNFVGLDTIVGPSGITLEEPRTVPVNRTNSHTIKGGVFTFGHIDGLDAMEDSRSYAYKYLLARLPHEWEKWLHEEPLTLEEAAKIARVMVDIEKQLTPNQVGLQTTVVVIPPEGLGSTTTYSQEVPIAPKNVVSGKKSK